VNGFGVVMFKVPIWNLKTAGPNKLDGWVNSVVKFWRLSELTWVAEALV
jgi:hypothetical protein